MTHLHSPAQQFSTSLGFPPFLICISTSRFIAGGFAEFFHPPNIKTRCTFFCSFLKGQLLRLLEASH
ncbi:hypothetical protein RHMOL_Rhmol03G0010600 [Rhododendron molle]|uniref:Uncharacterized protein n=1 Tax=Rhododendron molle TaxID=49168 RepID=A0ACC0P8W5_RHOML|nr:hypothetical protein RHMOL_Rhmol03G0010600 [Rhododendron molle]